MPDEEAVAYFDAQASLVESSELVLTSDDLVTMCTSIDDADLTENQRSDFKQRITPRASPLRGISRAATPTEE